MNDWGGVKEDQVFRYVRDTLITSVTRLGDFRKFLATILFAKEGQKQWWLFGLFWKVSLHVKTAVASIWATFGLHFYSNIWSNCSKPSSSSYGVRVRYQNETTAVLGFHFITDNDKLTTTNNKYPAGKNRVSASLCTVTDLNVGLDQKFCFCFQWSPRVRWNTVR